jgi:hypothetical protein
MSSIFTTQAATESKASPKNGAKRLAKWKYSKQFNVRSAPRPESATATHGPNDKQGAEGEYNEGESYRCEGFEQCPRASLREA